MALPLFKSGNGPQNRAESEIQQPPLIRTVTLRSVVIGALLVPVLCAWTLYSEIVAQSTELAVMSLSVAAVFALLMLLLLNALLKRFLPRFALTRAELLVVYTMQSTSIAISGVGMMQFLHISLSNVFHFATDENGWKQYFPYFQRLAFPDPSALKAYYIGKSSFFLTDHIRAWIGPICVWSLFLLALMGTMLCLNVILRRRWVDQERLTFPITALPLELTREGGGRSFFTNKAMLSGLAIAFLLQAAAGIAYLYPSIPFFPIKPSDSRLNLTAPPFGLLSPFVASSPWNAIGDLQMGFYPMVIGLTYLLPLDISFSCWFFFFLRKFEDVGATALGFRDPGASAAMARIPYYGEQSFGAFIGFAIFSLWSMRGYLKQVWQAALQRKSEFDDSGEPLSYRAALIGLSLGFLFMVGFAVWLGLAAWMAVLFFLLYLLVVITYTRIRAEAGMPWVFGPDMTPHQFLAAMQGTQSMGMGNMVALTQFQWMDLDYRPTLMPHQLEAFKIAAESRVNQRRLFGAILLATALGIICAWIGVLACYYKYGAATSHVDSWRTSMGSSPWYLLDSWNQNPTKFDGPRMEGVGFGILLTGALMLARTKLMWWPLHPIGYAVAGTFTMPWLWCPTMIGWLIKILVLRWGGMKLNRIVMPFFIGLILGDYISGSIWALIGCFGGISTYKVIPI